VPDGRVSFTDVLTICANDERVRLPEMSVTGPWHNVADDGVTDGVGLTVSLLVPLGDTDWLTDAEGEMLVLVDTLVEVVALTSVDTDPLTVLVTEVDVVPVPLTNTDPVRVADANTDPVGVAVAVRVKNTCGVRVSVITGVRDSLIDRLSVAVVDGATADRLTLPVTEIDGVRLAVTLRLGLDDAGCGVPDCDAATLLVVDSVTVDVTELDGVSDRDTAAADGDGSAKLVGVLDDEASTLATNSTVTVLALSLISDVRPLPPQVPSCTFCWLDSSQLSFPSMDTESPTI